MKLRYYLRGLAAGILLTTIILTIANAGNRPLTDAEIRQRALELGMIESDAVKLSSLQQDETGPANNGAGSSEGSSADGTEDSSEESTGTESTETESSGMKESSSAESTTESSAQNRTESSSAEGSAESMADSSMENSSEESSTEKSSSEGSSTEKSSAETTPAETTPADAQPVSFRIASGSNSYTVSKELAALGLVEDASAFDTFLCDNGYSKRIRVGTYEILPGTSEEEIAKMIAR